VRLGNGDGTFQQQVSYDVGNQPFGVTAGDVNLDGNIDLAVANSLDDTMSVLLGNGDGTFQPALTFQTGSSPFSVALGDVNNDGIPDAVSAGEEVSVLLGNGDGTFQAPNIMSEFAYSVALADFNHDEVLDIAVGTGYGSLGGVQILVGNGDGTFEARAHYSLNVATLYSIAVGDFNGDGTPDLAVTTFFDDVWVLLGKGDATFRPVPYGNPYGTYAAVVADFNRDGNSDISIADFSDPSYLSVLEGNGNGTFQPVVNYNGSGNSADAIAAADLNGDGSVDLVLANDGSDNLTIFLNTGGTFMRTSSSVNPSKVGESVTFTATVRHSVSGTGIPTGAVIFGDGTLSAKIKLVNGVASFTTSKLTQGTHHITASYSGDTNFNRNNAKPLVQVVKP
jgi:hypothetical protein